VLITPGRGKTLPGGGRTLSQDDGVPLFVKSHQMLLSRTFYPGGGRAHRSIVAVAIPTTPRFPMARLIACR
jgi:hypothetical protein